MLRSLWLLFIYISFLALGTAAPFVFALGYVWVDTFKPQEVAYIVLNQLPVALIMGAAAFGSYFMMDRRYPPRLTLASVLQIAMIVWSTTTMAWAESPVSAWDKWDWAFKTLCFAAFLPLVIRSRVQIEAFAQTYVFALAANFVPFGLKTMISGGGYGANLGLAQGNSGLSEGGLLSTICLMAVPIALYLGKHNELMPKGFFTKIAYWGVAALAVVTAIGTYERSALIGLVVMGLYMFARSRHKFGFGLVGAVVAILIVFTSSSVYKQRVDTLNDVSADNSALTRLLVWKWTFDHSLTHPFGGGFMAYEVNEIQFPPDATHPGGAIEHGRAFHSIYFEVLGETGWPGLAIFLTTAVSTLLGLRRLAKRTRTIPHLAWCADMSDALQSGIAVFMTSGAFVGIAFQPTFWYFIAMSISLREYVHRVETMPDTAALSGWRGIAQAKAMAGGAAVPAGMRRG